MVDPRKMKMRFATLLKHHGPVKRADAVTETEWKTAVAEGRFMTVYHGETDWCTPLEGRVRHHGCVNTLCKLVFTRPVPAAVDTVIGLRTNQDAWNLCNP